MISLGARSAVGGLPGDGSSGDFEDAVDEFSIKDRWPVGQPAPKSHAVDDEHIRPRLLLDGQLRRADRDNDRADVVSIPQRCTEQPTWTRRFVSTVPDVRLTVSVDHERVTANPNLPTVV